MNRDEEKKKIETDPDYIYCPSAGNSLERFMSKHPDGVKDDKAAQVLLMTPDRVRELYEEAVQMIRDDLGVEADEE